MRGKSARYRKRGRLCCQLDRVFVAENSYRLLELFGLERLFQNRHRTFGKNAIQHLAVGITGNDDDWTVRLVFFDRIVNVIGWAIGQFEIEKDEIELLFFERGDRFLDGSDDNAAETDFLEEELEKILQALVVIDDENSGLSGLLLLEDILIERVLFDPPTTTDLNRGQLPALHQIVNRRKWNSEVFGGFLNG